MNSFFYPPNENACKLKVRANAMLKPKKDGLNKKPGREVNIKAKPVFVISRFAKVQAKSQRSWLFIELLVLFPYK